MWPAIIGAAGSLIGGAVSAFGQGQANRATAESAAADRALQLKFAQSGVRWRAMDAMKGYEKTGLHPLALLGVQPSSYSPVGVQFGNEAGEFGRGLQQAGQDVSRAMMAAEDRDVRARQVGVQETLARLAVQRSVLDNELLAVQVLSAKQRLGQTSMPGVPNPGKSAVVDPGRVVGPSYEYVKTDTGYMLVKSDAAQQRLEDDFVGTSIWNVRHRLPPLDPPRVPLKANQYWKWHPEIQEWRIYSGKHAVTVPIPR